LQGDLEDEGEVFVEEAGAAGGVTVQDLRLISWQVGSWEMRSWVG
jgi:hypothetical protein